MDESSEAAIEIIEKQQAEDAPTPLSSNDDVRLLSLQGYFNITGNITGRAKTQLQKVLEFASEDSEDEVDILVALRHLENRLGTPRADESRLGNVYNYIRSLEAVRQAEKNRDSFLR